MSEHPDHDVIGRTVDGRYRIERHLADGGMAGVYVAHDTRLGRDVALKILRPDLARSPQFAARFEREARAAAGLSHPNIVAVQDQGNDGSFVFIAMELVRGRTLRAVIDEGGVSTEQALELFDAVLAGLAQAHAGGLAHGDVKPENVLVDDSGAVKITDFGLARAATGADNTSGMLLGTASYIAPELVEREGAPDARSDVYSAGLVLFELLTGHKAFDGPRAITVAFEHVTGSVPSLASSSESVDPAAEGSNRDDVTASAVRKAPAAASVPDTVVSAFDPVIARACAKDPDARPGDAGELRDDVARARADLPASSLASATPVRPRASAPPTGGHTEVIDSTSHTRVLVSGASATGSARSRRKPLIAGGIAAVIALGALAAAGLGLFGSDSHTVPQVAGMTRAEAEKQLRDAGFDVTVSQREGTQKVDTAIETRPEHGHTADDGSTVELYVSKGPKRATVPPVVGLSETDARSRLEDAGFSVGATTTVTSGSPSGQVVATTPAAGTTADTASGVTLQVSGGAGAPAAGQVTVPSLIGMSYDTARAVLNSFGLQPESAPVAGSASVNAQSPAAGTVVPPGSSVQLR